MFNELVLFKDKIFLSNGLKIFSIRDGVFNLEIDFKLLFGIENTFIRKIAVNDSNLAVVFDSKLFLLIDLKSMKKTFETNTFKRAMFMQFSKKEKSIYLGDRAGDIYEIHLSAESPIKLLVGSVSISTDMAFSNDGKFLITSDRDEKIRVNHFPNTYDVNHFCLGHKEYVSKVVVVPNTEYFLSAGGDKDIFMWNYVTGVLIDTISLTDNIQLGELKPDVACMELFGDKLLLVLLQKYKSILLFEIEQNQLIFKKTIDLKHEPLKACFDSKGNIWCTTTSDEELIVLALSRCEYHLATKDSKELSKLKIDRSAITKDPSDFYEISKLRKWSQWEPNFRIPSVAEKRKVIEESGQVKKTKRSGKKQKEKETLNHT